MLLTLLYVKLELKETLKESYKYKENTPIY